jgi:hypothetical protein
MDLLPKTISKQCTHTTCQNKTIHNYSQYFTISEKTKYILCHLPTADYHSHLYKTKIKNFNYNNFKTSVITNEKQEAIKLEVANIILFDNNKKHYTIIKRFKNNWITIDSLNNTYNNDSCNFVEDLANVTCILFKII